MGCYNDSREHDVTRERAVQIHEALIAIRSEILFECMMEGSDFETEWQAIVMNADRARDWLSTVVEGRE